MRDGDIGAAALVEDMDDCAVEGLHDVGIADLGRATDTPAPRFRVLAILDENQSVRRMAFRGSPRCVHCDKALDYPDEGHVVPTVAGIRLAHTGDCFTQALVTHAAAVRSMCAAGAR